jgi:glutamate N-acetyltransferase / amino-acid N-acetyltransferase
LMEATLPKLLTEMDGGNERGGLDAARAIMTTDLKRKEAAFEAEIDGKMVRVGGMAKGSGMIHPNMATMLSFVTCDADVEPASWQAMLERAADKSFNMITVDGDTSTNDILFALCSGDSGVKTGSDSGPNSAANVVEDMLTRTCVELAKQIARDGEGATVLLEVRVTGAKCEADARKVARTVASSSLLKAAIYGRDPNWGRIAAAAGRAGVEFNASRMSVGLGDFVLVRGGEPVPFDAAAASAYMKNKADAVERAEAYCSEEDTVVVEVGLGDGPGCGTAWGCDLTYKYVEINAEYST